MYRAERADGKGKVEGYYHEATLNYQNDLRMFVIFNGVKEYNPIKPETLEIYLFGSWHKVSELEKPCEWKLAKVEKDGVDFNICGNRGMFKPNYTTWKFCPYCGRPIKEVG